MENWWYLKTAKSLEACGRSSSVLRVPSLTFELRGENFIRLSN
jgi:hypothetical protein